MHIAWSGIERLRYRPGSMRRDLLSVIGLVGAILVLAVGGPLLVGQLGRLPHRALAARAGERIVTLEVAGMTCTGCARSVESRLATVAGVSAATVRFPQRRAYVVCARAVPESALVAAVRSAGPGFSAAIAER